MRSRIVRILLTLVEQYTDDDDRYPYSPPFASFAGSVNIIAFHTNRYANAPLIIQGSGAGAEVTAMGVVADAVKVAERFGVRFQL